LKIGNTSAPVSSGAAASGKKVRSEPGPANRSDQVQLSQLPSSAAADASRSARIAELGIQVQNGTYRVSAEDVAKSIIDDALGHPRS